MSIEVKAAAVREYAHSEQSKLMTSMFDELIAIYHEQLEEVRDERLIELQAAVRQIKAIRSLLVGKQHADPRI